MRLGTSAAAPLVLLLSIAAQSHAEIVYDSISDNYLNGIRAEHTPEAGQAITLAGTSRVVTKIELQVTGNELADFVIRFRRLDGLDDHPIFDTTGHPETIMWESPVQTFPWDPPAFNRKRVVFDVPYITVPDTFAWTLHWLIPEKTVGVMGGSADSDHRGCFVKVGL